MKDAVYKIARLALSLVIVFSLTGCVSWFAPKVTPGIIALKEGQYQLDNQHATLLFKVDHMGLSSFVGRFNEFQASLDFNPEDFSATSLEAKVVMGSIDVNDRDFESTLADRNWLNAEQFPEAYFRTISVKKADGQEAVFTGEMTFLGVTKPLDIRVNFRGGARNPLTGKYTVGFSADAVFRRSDYGLDKFIPIVGDEIRIEVYAEFYK